MTTYVPVNKTAHANQCWQPAIGYRHAAQHGQAPVLLHEVPLLLTDMALAFMKTSPEAAADPAQPGGFLLCGLMHLLPDANLFVGPDGRWLGRYVPEALRVYPLALQRVANRDDKILCVAAGSVVPVGAPAAATPTQAKPFFQNDGQIAPETAAVLKLLQQFEPQSPTQRAVDALAAHGMLEAWSLRTTVDGRGELPVQGLWSVNKTALLAASGEVMVQLRDVGALGLAYAQLWSMPLVNKLPALAQYAARLTQQAQVATQTQTRGAATFQMPQGDTLKFS